MAHEAQHAWRLELRSIMHKHAVGEPQDYGVRIIRRHEGAMIGRDGQALAVLGFGHDEEAREITPAIPALLDPERHPFPELGELAHLDRSAERARPQLEPQA